MGKFEEAKLSIDANVTSNGSEAITGGTLNAVLTEMNEAARSEVTRLSQEWQEIKDANFNVIINPHIEVVDMIGQTAATIEPDKYYVFGEVSSLAVGFAPAVDGTIGNYAFQFTSPADAPTTLSIPMGVKFPKESGSALQIEGNTIYQISIVNNLAVAISWEA